MRTGASLFELLVVLGLVALLTSIVVPAAAGASDRAAVRAAQQAFAHVIRSARLRARQSGGVQLSVDLDSARVAITGVGTSEPVLSLREFGVRLDARGSRTQLLRFDRAGIGRFASRTFSLTRGGETAMVVVSSYGRVVRR